MHTQINSIIFLPGWGFKSTITNLIDLKQFKLPYQSLDLPIISNPTAPTDAQLKLLCTKLANNIPKYSLVIGWSLGGLIGMKIKHLFPEKSLKLITFNASPKFIQHTTWPGISATQINKFHSNNPNDTHKIMRRFMHLILHPKSSKTSLQDLTNHLISSQNITHIQSYLNILINSDIRDIFTKNSSRDLYIFSENDCIVPINTADAVLKLNTNARVHIIKNSNHFPLLCNTSECSKLISTEIEKTI